MALGLRRITKPTAKARLSSNTYTAFLFDLDGVLVNAVEWHAEAFLKAIREAGYELSADDHMRNLNGLPTMEKLRKLRVLERDREGIAARKKELTYELFLKHCKPDQEKIDLLALLDREGYFVACCSNAKTESVHKMLELSGLDLYVDVVLGSDDVQYPKPDPEIYLKAAELLDVSPKHCMIFEDSDVGVEAAKRSYMSYLRVTYDMVNADLVRGYIEGDLPSQRHARIRHKRSSLSTGRHAHSPRRLHVGQATGRDDLGFDPGQS